MSYPPFCTRRVRKQHSAHTARRIFFSEDQRTSLCKLKKTNPLVQPRSPRLQRQSACTSGDLRPSCLRGACTLRMVRQLLSIAVLLTACVAPAAAADHTPDAKLDRELRVRARAPRGHSRVIVRLSPGVSGDALIRGVRGTAGRRLASVGGQVADVPDSALATLARLPGVDGISLDRRVHGTL